MITIVHGCNLEDRSLFIKTWRNKSSLCECTHKPGPRYLKSNTGWVIYSKDLQWFCNLMFSVSELFLLNAIQAIFSSFYFPWLMLSDKLLSKEEVESHKWFSLTFPCYQQTIIHSCPPLYLHLSILCSMLPGLLWLPVSADDDTRWLFC